MAIQSKMVVPPFPTSTLTALSKILGDTDRGLTGSAIADTLQQCRIPDVDPQNTKWRRLFNAFTEFQNEHEAGNHVVQFIIKTMSPASHTNDPGWYEERRQSLNAVLCFAGMELGKDGKIRHVQQATDLDDALERANRMKDELRRRNVHSEVVRFCDAEIIVNNYFHAVFEAIKSITSRIRALSACTSDGVALVDAAFSIGKYNQPLVAINALGTETERGEQRGFANLLKGLYGTVRNPLGHEAKIEWEMTEQDALDILTTVSLIHRKLDMARSGMNQ